MGNPCRAGFPLAVELTLLAQVGQISGCFSAEHPLLHLQHPFSTARAFGGGVRMCMVLFQHEAICQGAPDLLGWWAHLEQEEDAEGTFLRVPRQQLSTKTFWEGS